MTYYLTYQIKGINGQFIIPIQQGDTVKYICTLIKKDFGIIPNLTARIYGSELQSTNILSQCVRNEDIVTFVSKETEEDKTKKFFYRQPIIIPRYQSNDTFIVFTTINFQSMIKGDKIQVDIAKDDVQSIEKKIKNMFKKNYSKISNIDKKVNSMKILLFLPGGIPFLVGTINQFVESFPDFMPHLYAIILYDKSITDQVLNTIFDRVCNVSNKIMKSLISPDNNSDTYSLCEIASVLGYIQQKGPSVERMIYSIAKFCPFAPMICGLYNLSNLSRVTGRTIVQITAPLIVLFSQMADKFNEQILFSSSVKFLTYFMNIKISDRIPCTEFIRPFYKIGFEKYFDDMFPEEKYKFLTSFIAFDPDFRDQDWIRFELPKLTENDFENAMNHTKTLDIIPPMSLREMHRYSLFQGTNGPWLFLAASVSKEETERDKIDYINPEKGEIEHDTYENIAVKAVGIDYKNKNKSDEFDEKVVDQIDPEKVTQLVFIVIDKSGSMCCGFGEGNNSWRAPLDKNRFAASQKFFIKFTEACYTFHTTSLYGSIMFNHETEVRNQLNPLVSNFKERMIIPGERPSGGTCMFTAMKAGADLMLKANEGNKYPYAVLRLIVISDGEDGCNKSEQANVFNFILQNKIRVDAIIVSDEVAKELVEVSRASGGIAICPQTVDEGLQLFNREEFFNVNLRKFGPIRAADMTGSKLSSLPRLTVDQLDKNIDIKPNEYADDRKVVTSPLTAIAEYDIEVNKQLESGGTLHEVHPNQKRIVNELRKINSNPVEDIRVFPLKDRVDVWRVLIKGIEGSMYENRWFYMIIEFPPEYPQHYPLFRFIHPPFHPNITDQGRVCMDTLDQRYRSDMSILELLGDIRLLMLEPNFDSCVDLEREKHRAEMIEYLHKKAEAKPESEEAKQESEKPIIPSIVQKWNEDNSKSSPEEWESEWKIEKNDESIKIAAKASIVPEHFLCPISRKIMKEPVKATSGVYYEKVELEKYLKSTTHPTCRVKTDSKGKPVELNVEKNMGLKVDNEMKSKIAKWIKDNDYREDEEEGDEEENIIYFNQTGKEIKSAKYDEKFAKDAKKSPKTAKCRSRPILSSVPKTETPEKK